MHTIKQTTRSVVGCSVFAAAVLATLASACSSDDSGSQASVDSGSEASASGDDATADQSTPPGDGSSQGDVTTNDTSTGEDAADDGSTTTISDAAGDVVAAEAAAPSDAGSKDGAASDANAPDGAAEASTADASEAGGGVCVTTLSSLGASGTNDAATSKILDDFDGQADAGPGSSWSGFFNSGSVGTFGVTGTDGHTCDGALALAVTTYTQYGTNVQAYFNYGGSVQDWTGYKKLHAWLKVVSSDYSTIQGVEPRVDSSNYTQKLYGGFVNGSAFADGGWHETVVPLTASASYVPAVVNGYQFELQLVGSKPGAAAATPPAATLLVDSIWIE
jgi:hypothetical protein